MRWEPCWAVIVVIAGCVDPGLEPEPGPEIGVERSEVRVCADGPVVEGIDVSKWQTDVDWDEVADAGIRFAFIRVNHGLTDIDEKFAYNWAEAERVGIIRGAYQYFLPNEDAIEQAELMLDLMGPLSYGDLPPVLDVEEAAGQPPEVIREKVRLWMDHVEAAIGRKPIIYTAKYFWQDGVGAPDDFLDHPLWVANYEVDCPLMADPWPRWDFWQYTSSGRLPGVPTNVDRNHWNGTYAELVDFTIQPESYPDPDPMPDPDPTPDPAPDPETDPEPPPPAACSAGGPAAPGWLLCIPAIFLVVLRRRSSHM